ncbi:MAG: hypothetical protein CFH19_01076 [Alphaproteobacteria bacterium MarineAlpha5_Bin9]|nr:MAG: hypothetical protein CFH19_01076 [Alphaproteobacteria bacterium MarineAlpha5_Bin9]|tara:strand:+ start:17917 stop:18738 length:822 start_codon:yes stop_codon:yes gene_type:complete
MEFQILTLFLAFLLTGFFSGLIAGLLGVGGGIITVPVTYYVLISLNYTMDVVMHCAIASSLAIILLTSLSSIRSHSILGNIDLLIIKKIVFGVILGSILGSIFASLIQGKYLIFIFIVFAFLISLNLFFDKKFSNILEDLPRNNILNNLIGGVIGFLSALIGIGGGTFTVPTLLAFSKGIHKAVGTSTLVGFFISLPGFLTYIFTGWNVPNLPPFSIGYVNILIVLITASVSIITAHFGARISNKTKTLALKKIFAVFLFCTCISLLLKEFFL